MTVKVPSVRIVELNANETIAIVDFSAPFYVDSKADMRLRQTIRVDMCDNVAPLKTILKRISVVGPGELRRITLKLSFRISISFMDFLLVLENIPCSKTVNLGDVQALIHAKSSSPHTLKDNVLFPNPEITPFAHPGLRGVEAGLAVTFSKPPQLTINLGKIKCQTTLNGSRVATSVISGLYLSSTSSHARMSIEIQPAALSNKPISGAVSSAKGILKGFVKGTVNGLLFNDWGGAAVVLGIKELVIENSDGRTVWWVQELLQGIEFEHDLDAVHKLKSKLRGEKTGDLSEAIERMLFMSLKQSNCPIM
ncbi:hypothetical protein HDU91_003094 [Kappamyces sp. JEL0680]|nr:hypothetical protein HDU91_003094 [Kappamyces sp. JEL0680]